MERELAESESDAHRLARGGDCAGLRVLAGLAEEAVWWDKDAGLYTVEPEPEPEAEPEAEPASEAEAEADAEAEAEAELELEPEPEPEPGAEAEAEAEATRQLGLLRARRSDKRSAAHIAAEQGQAEVLVM